MMEGRGVPRALVVYESMFGNGRAVANAVADGIARSMHVDLVEVGEAPTSFGDDIALLVVGGPTHTFTLSRPATRAEAASRTGRDVVSRGKGLREWLVEVTAPAGGAAVAAYATHTSAPRLIAQLRTVEAAIERRFRRVGVRRILPRASYFVEGTTGPLVPGELERALHWGERLAAAVASQAHEPAAAIGDAQGATASARNVVT